MSKPFHTHFSSFGSAPRQALAIHCTLSHGGAWKGVAQFLAGHLTLRACDLPGHGKSDDWDRQTDLHELCVTALLPMPDEKVDLIGHSFGATIALRLAIEYPDQIRSLCLIEPVLFAAAALDDPEALAHYKAQTAEVFDDSLHQDMTGVARRFNRVWGDGRNWKEIPSATREYITARMHLVRAQEAALFEDAASLLEPKRLGRVAMPVLLIEGDQSPPIVTSINKALAERLPNARRATVHGAGHMAPITHPREIGALIVGLLEETEE